MPRRILLVGLISLALGLIGCWSYREPPANPTRYRLDYADPEIPPLSRLPQIVIRVDPFGAPPPLRDERVTFHESRLTTSYYPYHRWISPPPDLVTFYLARDLQQSGLFHAVFVFDQQADATHAIRGTLLSFGEEDRPDGWEAVLEVNLALIRAQEHDPAQQVLIQRRYRITESAPARSPDAVATAMSRAMQRFSAMVAVDIHQVLDEAAVCR